MKLRLLLSGAVLVLGCPGQITGGLPKFDITGLTSEGNFNIVWSGSVPRRVTIAPEEPFKTQNQSLSTDAIRQTALSFVTQNAEFLRAHGAELYVDIAESDGPHHHAFLAQNLNGRPVFNAGIDIFFTDAMQLEVVHNQLAPALSVPIGNEISTAAAINAALATLSPDAILASAPAPVLGYEVNEGSVEAVYRVRVTTENPDQDQYIFIDAETGAVREIRDLLIDVTARGNAFPKSNRALGPSAQVTFDVDGSGFLRFSDIDAQVGSGSRASSNQGNFSFTNTDPHFGEVNTFFHLQSLSKLLKQNGINFITERFPVRVRGTAAVNAFYDPSRRRVVIGNAQGIDLSFDGDVAVHEYGHALLDRIKPGLLGSSPEAGAIHEAFGDVLTMYFFQNPDITEGFALDIIEKLGASAYSQICPGFALDLSRPRCRSGENSLVYPRDMTGEVHFDGMILTGPLWEIFRIMVTEDPSGGRNRAIKTLVRAASFLPTTNARFTDFLAGMVEADRTLNAGKFRADIVNSFLRHGISRPDIFQCLSSSDCGGDRCEQGFCTAGNPQPTACTESTGCQDASLTCDAGLCIPSEGGSFFLEVSASNLPIAIPDNNQAGTSVTIPVPVDVTIKKLEAKVNIKHTFSGDLTVSLVSPQGQVIVLQDREGASANDINRTFEVIGLNSQSGKGDWTLRVIDRGPQDSGTIESLTLLFNQ